MKRPPLSSSSESPKIDMNEQILEAVIDTIKNSNDKVVEIRPANKSNGGGKLRWLLLIGVALVVSSWLRKPEKSTDKLQSMASETADRTKKVTEQAAETIQEGGETISTRLEDGSQKASEQVQQMSENAATKAEQAGEKAAETIQESSETMSKRVEEESQKTGEKVQQTGESVAEATEQAGEKAAEKTDESGSGSSGSSSSS